MILRNHLKYFKRFLFFNNSRELSNLKLSMEYFDYINVFKAKKMDNSELFYTQ